MHGGFVGICHDLSQYLQQLNTISVFFRLVLALALGSIIGIDRGFKRRVAGFKTHTIVCLGSTLVMMTGQYISIYINPEGVGDVARLGAQVISGVGFLGVGTIIITRNNQVKGLTTAASLWTCSCIGLAVGIGFYSGAIMTTIFVMLVFRYFTAVDKYIYKHTRVYDFYIEFENTDSMNRVLENLKIENIKVTNIIITKKKCKSHTLIVQITLEPEKWRSQKDLYLLLKGMDGVVAVDELEI